MICGVTPTKLPNGELAAYLTILRTHNQVLETHGSKSGLSMESFREEFLSGRLKVKLTTKEQTAIQSLTEDIKAKIIAHHVRMVQKIALHYCRSFNVTGRNRADIVTEGVCGLMKALYAYTSDIRFSTFSHWAITNTLKDYFRENNNGLSPVSKRGIGINNQIAAHRLESNDSISFDRAVAELNLSDKEVAEALDASCCASPESAVIGATYREQELGSLLEKATVEPILNDEMELKEAYMLCDLTEFERAVMDAAIEPWHGWMVDLGRDYPTEEGNPRSRQHIRMVLKRVQRKVQAQYEEMYSCKHEAAVA
jgi:RNA polymerase sigma factor (sigma-70 family)